MIELSIPGTGDFTLRYLVLDVNGTIAQGGRLVEGVRERLQTVSSCLDIHLLTADTHGRQDKIDSELGMRATRITSSDEAGEKTRYVEELGSSGVIAMGNGAIDAGMLSQAELSIVILGAEGLAIEALKMADIVVRDIRDGLDLLINLQRLVATLRK